jgi:hypothetical protein
MSISDFVESLSITGKSSKKIQVTVKKVYGDKAFNRTQT